LSIRRKPEKLIVAEAILLSWKGRMDIHKNARLTFISREELAKRVLHDHVSLNSAAAEFKVAPKTAAKWVRRYRHHGRAGLLDRSSRPHRSPRRIPDTQVRKVEALRRLRQSGVQIALATGLSRATVSRILQRLKLNRIRDLEPAPPTLRYEHAAPGDLLHLDIKKIGRFGAVGIRFRGDHKRKVKNMGWEYLHVAIDDHSRIAFVQILPNQKADSAATFLRAAVADYARLGITIRRVLTDNGPCYRSGTFRRCCRQLGISQRFTRPYTPRTNGKAERFIQTAIREWAYAKAYENSLQRAAELPHWVKHYNYHRPHASLAFAPPISRSGKVPIGTTC
jgi:transposase InsO family protein